MKSVWMKFHNALRAFGAARGGNVAMIFALAIIPIIVGIGFAIDYSRANAVKTALQAALDSTALMISKEAAGDTPDQLQQNALKYFKAVFNSKFIPGGQGDASGISLTASYSSSNGTQLILTAAATVPTTFLGIVPGNTCGCLNVTTSTTAKWGLTRLRVALVLDNTGSMAQSGKMSALISATKSLLTQLQNAASQNGDVYVSIVPFVKDVNLDPSEYNSDWIYWGTSTQDPNKTDDTSWDANNGTCSRWSSSSTRSSCYAPYCSKTQYKTQTRCQSNGGTWITTAGTWTPYAHNDSQHGWNGCVMDRGFPASPSYLTVSGSSKSGPDTTNNYDTNVVQPDVTKMASLYAAEQYSSCPQAAMGLSYDWTTMNQLVNNMVANGNTNQAIGLQLGWLSLVGGGPFTAPAMDPNYTYTQAIILLTDGLNTENRWYTSQTSIDTRQQMTCNNINAAGITLYTIQVNTDGEPTSTLLQNCAGSPGKYPDSNKFYLLTSSSQILNVFTQIGTELTKLRIAQ